ncbi:MAG: DUF1592 domain-containing protein [Planctomycetota bacterium]
MSTVYRHQAEFFRRYMARTGRGIGFIDSPRGRRFWWLAATLFLFSTTPFTSSEQVSAQEPQNDVRGFDDGFDAGQEDDEFDEEAEDDEPGDDDFDDEDEVDFEDEEEHDEFDLGELREIRRELTAELQERHGAKSELRACIRSIDELTKLISQRQQLEAAVESAEDRDDESTLRRLFPQLRRVNSVLEARERVFNLQLHQIEVGEYLDELMEAEDEDRHRLAETLESGIREAGELANRFLKMRLAGKESIAHSIEEELESVFDERVHAPMRAIDLLAEIDKARDADEQDLADELREELAELKREFDLGIEVDESEERLRPLPRFRSKPQQPPPQPILVTEESLSRYADVDLDREVRPLLKRYCFECHSSDSSSGELDFEQLLDVSPVVKNRRKWINVIEQTKNHVMPPEDATQPSFDEREKITLGLHHAIFNFDYSGVSDPGFESARRLSHREYSNTVRDLFGVELDVTDRFPQELTATSGFANSANSLFLQPLLMERYVSLAEYVVDLALPITSTGKNNENAAERLIVARPSDAESVASAARKVMRPFLRRAFRRTPSEAEVERYGKRIESAFASGESFDESVKSTLRTVLVSPSFLLLAERVGAEDGQAYEVGGFGLASRLSYFLWASMPDDLLLDLAERGELAKPEVIAGQVERMLADPKSNSLGDVFAAQWLGSQHLGTRVRLDPIDNPWCTESLMAAMRKETSMFFNHLVRKNRPITELVSANYTYLNEELADLYRIEGVVGSQMRRVNIDTGRRGGILGHGSLLAVTSFPGRTSPVVRGKWILDTVLGTPPPPPPPDVSELSEKLDSERLSFREKLELHRDRPSCYACHSQMDPLGFSLENYDWFGRYRSRRGRSRIDSKGKLPNGTEFEGFSGLKQVILQQRQDDLIRQLTQKMLTYALGRQLEYYDEPAVRKIMKNIGEKENRMGALIREIVVSYPFRYKRSPTASDEVASIDSERAFSR